VPEPQPAPRRPEPAQDQPAARLPTATVAPKPRQAPQVEQRVAQPGDRICGSCGEPNDPTRKFCRRCGASLVEAKIVAEKKRPWYRRLFGGPKQPKQYAAGERATTMQKAAPKGGGGIRGLLKGVGLVRGLIGLVVAVGIFGYIGIPSFQGVVNRVADPILHGGPTQIVDNIRKLVAPSPVVERPIAVTATSETKGHEAAKVIDGRSNTDWQGTDKALEITVTFKAPIDLGWVIVYPGNSQSFVELRRPSKIEFVLPDGSTKQITLQDVKDKQTFEIGAGTLDHLTIRILDDNGPETAPISISELEFFKKG
jgi:hypothetical protein